jgi:hypothetical protein
MEEYYGGGIPFSAVLKDSRKTNKRKKQRTKKRKSRMKSKSKENNCKCKIDKRLNTPEGLGFCPKCSPLNIIFTIHYACKTSNKVFDLRFLILPKS